MYCGVPVVTSAVGGQSWLIRNGKEGVHTAGSDDMEGAAKAVVNLVDNPDAWNKLSLNAKEKARSLVAARKMAELDQAVTEEMIKESGLKYIPQEARKTLVEPESVLETWSAGSWRAVATERRLFVSHGRLSRKVTEIPYWNISYIEHTIRAPWNILAAGFLPALILFIIFLLGPQWHSILENTFIATIEESFNSIITAFPQLGSRENLIILVAIIPMLIGLGAFVVLARIGFNLHGSRTKPIYLPHRFSEVVTFIRNIQDKQMSTATQTKKTRKEAKQRLE
jgi:hypothetical protein